MKTIQYMGSKKELLKFIEDSIEDYTKDKKDKINTFYDAFSGSGRVAYYFSDKYNIISSDKQHFSKVILDAYLNNTITNKVIEEYLDVLNTLPVEYFEETDKWFTENYATEYNDGISVGEDGNPKIWMKKNSMKIDMIRTKIDDPSFLKDTKKDQEIKNVLLLSLILGINKVSNVVGHQNGYLKKWSTNSKKDLFLENPFKADEESKKHTDKSNKKVAKKKHTHTNLVGDIYEILPQQTADIVYFDPPYGTNNENLSVATRYSSFYHLWNTIVKNDRPKLFGKAGKPIETKGWTPDLEKNKREVIIPKFKELVSMCNSRYVAFSYSNQGLVTYDEFMKLFEECGCTDIRCYKQGHKVNTQSKTAGKNVVFKVVGDTYEQLTEGKIQKEEKKVTFKSKKEEDIDLSDKETVKKTFTIQKEVVEVECFETLEGELYFEVKGLWINRDESTNDLEEYFFIMEKPLLSKEDIIKSVVKDLEENLTDDKHYSSNLKYLYTLIHNIEE